MLCVTILMVPHIYVWPLAAPSNDYIDEDLPDEDEPDASVRAPASLIPSNKSRSDTHSAIEPKSRC